MNSRHAATSWNPFAAGFGASLRLRQFWSERRVTPRILASSIFDEPMLAPPLEEILKNTDQNPGSEAS